MNTDIVHASLRQEINENATHALNVTNVVLALTGLAVVAAFEFRNPYVVLLPLMSLYYGRLVLFNNEQSIARLSVYLRLVVDEKYEKDLHAIRQEIWRSEQEADANRSFWKRPFASHSLLRERWIAPTLQRLFLFNGFLCIFFFALLIWLLEGTPATGTSASSPLILPFPYNVAIAIVVFFIWLWVTLRSRHYLADPFDEKGGIVEQYTQLFRQYVLSTRDSADRH